MRTPLARLRPCGARAAPPPPPPFHKSWIRACSYRLGPIGPIGISPMMTSMKSTHGSVALKHSVAQLYLSLNIVYRRPKRGPPLRSQGHCFSRPQVTRSLFFMRKLKQHRSQVVFLNCRGRAVALKMAPGRRSRKTPLGPHIGGVN